MAELDYAPYHKYLYPRVKRHDIRSGAIGHYEIIACRDGSLGGQGELNPNHDSEWSIRAGEVSSSPAGYIKDQGTGTDVQSPDRDPGSPPNATWYSPRAVDRLAKEKTYTQLATYVYGQAAGANYIQVNAQFGYYTFSTTFYFHRFRSAATLEFMGGNLDHTTANTVHTCGCVNDIDAGGATDAYTYQNGIDISHPSYDTPYSNDGNIQFSWTYTYGNDNSRDAVYGTKFIHEQIAMFTAGLM